MVNCMHKQSLEDILILIRVRSLGTFSLSFFISPLLSTWTWMIWGSIFLFRFSFSRFFCWNFALGCERMVYLGKKRREAGSEIAFITGFGKDGWMDGSGKLKNIRHSFASFFWFPLRLIDVFLIWLVRFRWHRFAFMLGVDRWGVLFEGYLWKVIFSWEGFGGVCMGCEVECRVVGIDVNN